MTPLEAYKLLHDVRADYIAMVRELDAIKRKVRPTDPWTMPIVKRMNKAMVDLAQAAGFGHQEQH